jgi:hypothetical protein
MFAQRKVGHAAPKGQSKFRVASGATGAVDATPGGHYRLVMGNESVWRCGDQNMRFCWALHGGADRATVEDGQPRTPDVVDVPRRQRLGKLNMTIPLTDKH